MHLCKTKEFFNIFFTFWLKLGVGPMNIPEQQVNTHFLHIRLIFSDDNKKQFLLLVGITHWMLCLEVQ